MTVGEPNATAIAQAIEYHERTKHHFDRYARSPGYMDWDNQPDPFRRFPGAPTAPLPLADLESSLAYDDLHAPAAAPSRPVDARAVGEFLQLSLALSAWKSTVGAQWALRVNPSSGNLHPTEGYLILGPVAGVGDRPAVYHYAPREHALERRAEFSMGTWNSLLAGFAPGSFFVGLASIHWREAWKYGERAYRYCQHDVGHALACLRFAAQTMGWRLRVLEGIGDDRIAALLGLDRAEDFHPDEREAPDLLAVVESAPARGDVPRTLPADAATSIAKGEWRGVANQLSAKHAPWPIIESVAQACHKPETDVAAADSPIVPATGFSPTAPATPASRIILQRRSAVDFDSRGSLSRERFFAMLARTAPRSDVCPWDAVAWPAAVDLALFVHRVEGVTPGLYFFARREASLDVAPARTLPDFVWRRVAGAPADFPLRLLRAGDCRALAGQLSCHQAIARDSCFSLGMLADFEPTLVATGAWSYRRLFWETGMIGQTLYLEAEAAGVRATGIGCFFDDPVHAWTLGVRDRSAQSLYHFTVGRPVDDLRLMTWPPYERAESKRPTTDVP